MSQNLGTILNFWPPRGTFWGSGWFPLNSASLKTPKTTKKATLKLVWCGFYTKLACFGQKWPFLVIFRNFQTSKRTSRLVPRAPHMSFYSDSFFCFRGFRRCWIEWWWLETSKTPLSTLIALTWPNHLDFYPFLTKNRPQKKTLSLKNLPEHVFGCPEVPRNQKIGSRSRHRRRAMNGVKRRVIGVETSKKMMKNSMGTQSSLSGAEGVSGAEC